MLLSLKTTVSGAGVVIWFGSIMLIRLMLVLFGVAKARWKLALTSSEVTGCPLTGTTLWKTASVRSLTVHVSPSGDSIDVARLFSGSRLSVVRGSVEVLKRNRPA